MGDRENGKDREIKKQSACVEALSALKKKTVTVDELQRMFCETDYGVFRETMERLVSGGFLEPVKSAGTNGRLPPLHCKYRIGILPGKGPEDKKTAIHEIRRLHPCLNVSGYIGKPEAFLRNRDVISGLSRYLWYHAALLDRPMSRKERSFSIWGREKLLDTEWTRVGEVLRFNGLDRAFLNFYDTPEPFFEYVHSFSDHMTVLILENKDTWYTFRKLLMETGRSRIFGRTLHALLYGEGNKISKDRALMEFGNECLGGNAGRELSFLYFGDLDPEGLRLFQRAASANPDLKLELFTDLYGVMIDLAGDRELPVSMDERKLEAPTDLLLSLLDEARADAVLRILDGGRYIPQEIVNWQVLDGFLT